MNPKPMKNLSLLTWALMAGIWGGWGGWGGWGNWGNWGSQAMAENASAEQIAFFEKKIRPVLTEKCYKCHSEKSEKVKGGLFLDTREGTRRGGDSGAAVVPGDLKESLLIEAVRYGTKDLAMPPEKNGGKLSDAVIQDLETWVKMGAPDPRDGASKIIKKYDTEQAKKWWSFQPVQKPVIPEVRDKEWARNDLDRLVLAGLEAKGLKPVGDADKASLMRRISFDLVGLPPSLKEIDAFIKDPAPEALAKVIAAEVPKWVKLAKDANIKAD